MTDLIDPVSMLLGHMTSPTVSIYEKSSVAVDLACEVIKPNLDLPYWSGANRLTLNVALHWPGQIYKFTWPTMPIEDLALLDEKLWHKEQFTLIIDGVLIDRSDWGYRIQRRRAARRPSRP